jgi:hypothetical protein
MLVEVNLAKESLLADVVEDQVAAADEVAYLNIQTHN